MTQCLVIAGQRVRLRLPDPDPAAVRLAPPSSAQPPLPDEAESARTTVPRDTEAEVRLATSVFRGLLEVLQGRRPAAQLAGALHDGSGATLAAWARRRDWRQTTLVSVRACRTAGHVIEASAHLAEAGRHLGVAARLERRDGRWSLVELELAAPAAVLGVAA